MIASNVAAVAPSAGAQVLYGSIVGNITDSTGGALPAATVVIEQTETKLRREVVTDAAGAYNFTAVPTGTYTVTRLDGWANRDLNVGAIVSLSPALPDTLKAEFGSWGPGRYDPRHHAFDGTNLIPLNSPSIPIEIPSIYRLKHVGFETSTGDGPISYWNSYVGVGQMGGHGSFSDPRIGLFISQTPDLVTPKLAALLDYQLRLRVPDPPPGSFDKEAAARGRDVFRNQAGCATCHQAPAFTDVLSGPDRTVPFLHEPLEVGMNPAYAARSATGKYRTTPLRGLWQHPPYFHDDSAADYSRS